MHRQFKRVVWDPAKSDQVFSDHGFDLAQAGRVFPGWVLEREDTRGCGEIRMQAIGEADGLLYRIVFTVRADLCRLITAWYADNDDEDLRHAYR